jgi:hypothetical protein
MAIFGRKLRAKWLRSSVSDHVMPIPNTILNVASPVSVEVAA